MEPVPDLLYDQCFLQQICKGLIFSLLRYPNPVISRMEHGPRTASTRSSVNFHGANVLFLITLLVASSGEKLLPQSCALSYLICQSGAAALQEQEYLYSSMHRAVCTINDCYFKTDITTKKAYPRFLSFSEEILSTGREANQSHFYLIF